MFKSDRYPIIQISCFLVLGIALSSYAYIKGVIMASDTINDYSPWADILIENNFNIFQFLEDVEFVHSPVFYYNWITILAVNKLVLGENWGLGIVCLNILAGISVAILLIKNLWDITEKPACIIFASLYLLLCNDFYLWIPFVLSDAIFSSICFLVFILTINLIQQTSDHLKRVFGVMILILFSIFFRPAWPPLLIFAIFCVPLAYFVNSITTDSQKRHKVTIKLILLACGLTPLIIFFHSYLMLYPDKWPFSFFKSTIFYISGDYHRGVVLYAHLETYHFPPSDILDYVFISLHKLVAFFYFDLAVNSFKHTLINYFFFTPVYGLSIFAIVQFFKGGNALSPSIWWCTLSSSIFIFLFALFHSLNQIDYDFRYRAPCMLPLILLATLGLNELINRFSKVP
jgi:hypothetical protein